MTDSMETPYAYQGIPATPAVMGELVLELFAGQVVRRSELIDSVTATHLERGGLPPNSAATTTMKKALQDLESSGKADKTGAQGWWRIAAAEGVVGAPTEKIEIEERRAAALSPGVYVYGFPSCRELAEVRGETRWPLKVGMSATDMDGRVVSQVGTSLPEAPEILARFETETPGTLERALHSILTLRGQDMADAPGSEWFMTSPGEVEEIVEWIDPQPPE